MITEAEIEAVARAICEAHGIIPESVADLLLAFGGVARTQIAAWRRIRSWEEGLRIRTPVGDGVSLTSMSHAHADD